jgi:hypothetical protein
MMHAPDTNLGMGAMEDIWTSPLQAVANPMIVAAPRETAGACAGDGDTAALGAADWLTLAAAPTFAMMALLTGVFGGPADLLCAAQGASPLSGMVPMYLLMSAFHSAPWLKLILSRRNGSRRPDAATPSGVARRERTRSGRDEGVHCNPATLVTPAL